MSVDIAGFEGLFKTLSGIDLSGEGPLSVPWREASADAVRAAVEPCVALLPRAYRAGYSSPLSDSMATLVDQLDPITLETLAGAVYDHKASAVRPQLRRFLAVVSNLYRSFLDREQRATLNLPLVEQLPPLAMFQQSGQTGPFTLPVDSIQQITGGTVGVVSLPATYRDHPLLWASLAHETGGHDVLHADPGLVPELRRGVQQIFGGGHAGAGGQVSSGRLLGLLWAYWMDEAASDVYGVLNIGPTFGLNLAAFFSALLSGFTGTATPRLRAATGPDQAGNLDVHPTDILRLDLIQGVVESLTGLSQASRAAYTSALDELSAMCGGDAATVSLQGLIRTDNGSGVKVNTSAPMSTMKAAARTVGSYIATAKLSALSGHSIQTIETWDDPDELAAQNVMNALRAGQSITHVGDDAQLLAGATLAAFAGAASYSDLTHSLNEALDASWASDPVWSIPTPDPAWINTSILPADQYGPSVDITWRL
ncbi:MAG: hypothetical protein JO100_08985 [Pseudonocardia sp.]|nr:hypothetical protein [Pseudonocardia sp.]